MVRLLVGDTDLGLSAVELCVRYSGTRWASSEDCAWPKGKVGAARGMCSVPTSPGHLDITSASFNGFGGEM